MRSGSYSIYHPVGAGRFLPELSPGALDAFKAVLVALPVACLAGLRSWRRRATFAPAAPRGDGLP